MVLTAIQETFIGILKTAGKPLRRTDIAARLDPPRQTLNPYQISRLDELKAQGYIVRDDKTVGQRPVFWYSAKGE